MKKVGKYPIEVFGYDFECNSKLCISARNQQYCHYIKGQCIKNRKSIKEDKTGICTLGAKRKGEDAYTPVIICPHRFREQSFFETIRENYLLHWSNLYWVKEVSIGSAGFVDYVAIELDKKNKIKDFLCVEIQAAGTTGTPYDYVLELVNDGKYSGKKYDYGINWANEFLKTMMQQVYKKGKIIQHWNRKIVFAVQDVAMRYIRENSDTSGLTNRDNNSPIDFLSFQLNWNNSNYKWDLIYDDIVSTDIEGVDKILGGVPVDEYLLVDSFVDNIEKKAIQDNVIPSNKSVYNIPPLEFQ